MFSRTFAALWRNATKAETESMRFPVNPEKYRTMQGDDRAQYRICRVLYNGELDHFIVQSSEIGRDNWHEVGVKHHRTQQAAQDWIDAMTRIVTIEPI